MKLMISVGRFILQCIYYVICLCPTQNKVVMISRQSNTPSIDFKLLEKEI